MLTRMKGMWQGWVWGLVAAFGAGGLVGCGTPSRAPAVGSRTMIHELNVVGLPVAVNLDDQPGADGVVVRLFAANRSLPRALPIRSGSLEVSAYEGTPSSAALPVPFQVWTYSPQELARREVSTTLGLGYNLLLSWVPRVLSSDRVTIIVRYQGPDGATVTSAPNSITASPF